MINQRTAGCLLPGKSDRRRRRDRDDKWMKGCSTQCSHLNVVVSVVVEVEDPVELRVHRDPQVVRVLDALAERLPRVLLHLDVVELPASRKV